MEWLLAGLVDDAVTIKHFQKCKIKSRESYMDASGISAAIRMSILWMVFKFWVLESRLGTWR